MYLWVIEEWESRDVFLRYDFCFPAFRRRSWEEDPGGGIGGEGVCEGIVDGWVTQYV